MNTAKQIEEGNDVIVFRVPKELSTQARIKASQMMISKSAICRTALFEYLASETGGTIAEVLPQY